MLLQPLSYLVIFVIVRSFTNLPSDSDKPYVLYALSAILPWSFFSSGIIKTTGSIISNITIIKKTNIKREVFPLSSICLSAIEFCAMLALFLIISMCMGYAPGPEIIMLPVLALMIAVFALSLGLFTAAFNVFLRDIQYVLGSSMPFLMLVCPVMYPISSIPEKYQWLYSLNPLAGIIEGFRDILIRGQWPDPVLLAKGGIIEAIIFIIGIFVYRYLGSYFADHA